MQVSYDSKALKQEHALGFEHLYTLIVTCEFFFFSTYFHGCFALHAFFKLFGTLSSEPKC